MKGRKMANQSDPRIEGMFRTDRRWALISVFALWALYAFVFWRIMPYIADPNILIALAVSAGLVLLFNTASIFALTSHYAEDKEHIYGLDLFYLDQMNKR
jgi:hypothetical protein